MPYPVFDFGDVLAHFGNIVLVLDEQVVHLLEERAARIAQLREKQGRVLKSEDLEASPS